MGARQRTPTQGLLHLYTAISALTFYRALLPRGCRRGERKQGGLACTSRSSAAGCGARRPRRAATAADGAAPGCADVGASCITHIELGNLLRHHHLLLGLWAAAEKEGAERRNTSVLRRCALPEAPAVGAYGSAAAALYRQRQCMCMRCVKWATPHPAPAQLTQGTCLAGSESAATVPSATNTPRPASSCPRAWYLPT